MLVVEYFWGYSRLVHGTYIRVQPHTRQILSAARKQTRFLVTVTYNAHAHHPTVVLCSVRQSRTCGMW